MLTSELKMLIYSICKIIVILIFLSVLSLNVILIEVILIALKTCTYCLSCIQVKHLIEIRFLTFQIVFVLTICIFFFFKLQPAGGLALNIFQLSNLFFTALFSMLLKTFWIYCRVFYDAWQNLEIVATKSPSSMALTPEIVPSDESVQFVGS